MNVKAQEFITKMKAEQREKELELRAEHLISLGLIDESVSKEEIIYSDGYDGYGWLWDDEKQKYYKKVEVKVPIEVTDEEYQEILKYAPRTEKQMVKEEPTSWAKIIKTIANILLIINIVGGIILCLILANDYYTDDFAWVPIVAALVYGLFYYPLIVGFSRIVAIAERKLQE